MKIAAEDLGYFYENTDGVYEVFSGISFEIESGEIALVVGNNGSGKTTLLQILGLLMKPKNGSITFEGEDPWKDLKTWRRRIGFSFQFPESQFFNLTVFDEVVFAAKNFGITDLESSYIEAMVTVGLDPNAYKSRLPFVLSGGEKRKVAIASIISHDPEILILDEPLVSLDWPSRCGMKKFLSLWKKKGKMAIIATHHAKFFEGLYDKIIKLS